MGMEDHVNSFISSCSKLDFGVVHASEEEKRFFRELNDEIIFLCKSLPDSIQTDALLFFMKCSRSSFEEKLNFFGFTYVPSWSIIYWLIYGHSDKNELKEKDIKDAKTAHSLALFLHYLDHQLSDHGMPVTHLSLLLRSQLWMIINNAWNNLADGVDQGHRIVRNFVDDYYSSLCGPIIIRTFENYCELFRKQMATGFIVPDLLIRKITSDTDFSKAIVTAFGSFGIAWRLLDDLQDIESDMMAGAKTSIYFCLSGKMKTLWDNLKGMNSNTGNEYIKFIIDSIIKNGIDTIIKERICKEIESAISVVDHYEMEPLGEEFRSLLKPLTNRRALQ